MPRPDGLLRAGFFPNSEIFFGDVKKAASPPQKSRLLPLIRPLYHKRGMRHN